MMNSLGEQQMLQWWAEGDSPVRHDSRVTYLVDGRTAMLTMCLHFMKARKYIYLANWGLTPKMEIVRGQDHCVEPADAEQQAAFMRQLRDEGLQQADIDFWLQHDLSLEAVLRYALSKGVEVKVLLWKCSSLFSHYDPRGAYEELSAAGISCILDPSAQGIMHHPIESLHQKISIVDGSYAFVGGVDPLIEHGGQYDRWDTPSHPFNTPLRQTDEHATPYPWHDIHSLIEGPAAGDVEKNFRQRWNDVVEHHHLDKTLLIPERPLPPAVETQSIVQVTRTIPEHTYHFPPAIIRSIAQSYSKALHNAQDFLYLENQYFWLHAYFGIDLPFIGTDSPEMEQNIREIGDVLQRGAAMTIILPDHPNAGRAFTDAGLARLRAEASEAVEEGRLEAFCLATCAQVEGQEHYRPVYVHAKVAIIDDHWATVGSANLNNRGMADDTEMNVATLDTVLARGLRLMLQAEHLGLVQDNDLFALSRLLGRQKQSGQEQARAAAVLHYLHETLGDPHVAMRLMHERAWDNLNRYQNKQPLIGHLLPYLTADEATQQGLSFEEEHGWIEEPAQRESGKIKSVPGNADAPSW